MISDVNAFHTAVEKGRKAAKEGLLVTFGIKPSRVETAYGYLELGAPSDDITTDLIGFIEKPNLAKAKEMVDAGCYLWNSGIFLFSAQSIISAFEKHAQSIISPVRAALDASSIDLGFCRLNAKAWSKLEDISIDYAVMEKASNLAVVPFDGGWSDLGSWDAVWRKSEQDSFGVARSGQSTAIDCQDTLLRSDSSTLEVVGIGLKNIAVVAMNDAVLVADMECGQDVKKAVELLKVKDASQATVFPKGHRPWGWFETLVIAKQFHVKRIHVHPGGSLSLQSHRHRSEHWVVVLGIAEVTIDDVIQLVGENQSVYLPQGSVHRLKNPGKTPMVLIEVQTGTYFGEDDIIRYDDAYARN